MLERPQRQSSPLLTQDEVADLFKISARTIERWRVTGEGPPYIKLNRKVAYRWADISAWIEARLRRSTSDIGGRQ